MPNNPNKSSSPQARSKTPDEVPPLRAAEEAHDGCWDDHLNANSFGSANKSIGGNEGFLQPNAGKARIPIWLCVLLALVVLWAQDWFRRQSAGFDPQIYYPIVSQDELALLNPPQPENPLVASGKGLYLQVCVSCHQLDGQGVPEQNPPLVGTDWVLAHSPNRVVRIVLNGLQGPVTVKGSEFNAVMAPWKDLLSDRQIAAVLTYIRQEWGNNRPNVTPEWVNSIREADSARDASWTAEELSTLPDGD